MKWAWWIKTAKNKGVSQLHKAFLSVKYLTKLSSVFSEVDHNMPYGFSLPFFKSKQERERDKIKADAQKKVAEANERGRYVILAQTGFL